MLRTYMNIQTVTTGDPNTTDYRVWFQNNDSLISPFHSIPYKDTYYNFICEIPKGTTAKMEINKSEPLNPIKQDMKNGKLRHVTYKGGYQWNYGAFPQTWEDPSHLDTDTGAYGDNDPLDVCEIGSTSISTGRVKPVKVLGTIGLIDEGETDWKILTISINDPLAEKLNDLNDINTHMPGYLDMMKEWLFNYKTVDGKPQNSFAFGGQFKDREFAIRIIEESHLFWKDLVSGKSTNPGIALRST